MKLLKDGEIMCPRRGLLQGLLHHGRDSRRLWGACRARTTLPMRDAQGSR